MKIVPPPTRFPPCITPGCDCLHDPRGYPTGCVQGFEPEVPGRRARICKTCRKYRRRKADEKKAARQARKTTTPPKEPIP